MDGLLQTATKQFALWITGTIDDQKNVWKTLNKKNKKQQEKKIEARLLWQKKKKKKWKKKKERWNLTTQGYIDVFVSNIGTKTRWA